MKRLGRGYREKEKGKERGKWRRRKEKGRKGEKKEELRDLLFMIEG